MGQRNRILEYMRQFGSITQGEAYEKLGIARLGARIYDMRQDGLNIATENVTARNRYGEPVRIARYWMMDTGQKGGGSVV